MERQRLPPAWLLYAVTAAVCWGIWGVLSKGPSRELSGWMTQVLFTFAACAAYRFQGKAAIVTPLAAAVQPLVTLVLAFTFLGERVLLLEAGGIVLAILAAVALSMETKPRPTPRSGEPQ